MINMSKIDWCSKQQVIALARAMGPGQTVIKRAHLDNYNIIHTSREPDRLQGATVVLRT